MVGLVNRRHRFADWEQKQVMTAWHRTGPSRAGSVADRRGVVLIWPNRSLHTHRAQSPSLH
jgi:hypothetical protein